MSKRYAIWDKKSAIITPINEVLTAEQWMERYPVCNISNLHIVCAAGVYNGGFFGVLEQMVATANAAGAEIAENQGAQELLDAVEAWEDAKKARSDENTPEERIAAALELANLLAMPVVNPDDPDLL